MSELNVIVAKVRRTYHQDIETTDDKAQEPGRLLKLLHVFAKHGACDPALYQTEDTESVSRGNDRDVVDVPLGEALRRDDEFRGDEDEDDED